MAVASPRRRWAAIFTALLCGEDAAAQKGVVLSRRSVTLELLQHRLRTFVKRKSTLAAVVSLKL
jgi:hypothetical protein